MDAHAVKHQLNLIVLICIHRDRSHKRATKNIGSFIRYGNTAVRDANSVRARVCRGVRKDDHSSGTNVKRGIVITRRKDLLTLHWRQIGALFRRSAACGKKNQRRKKRKQNNFPCHSSSLQLVYSAILP